MIECKSTHSFQDVRINGNHKITIVKLVNKLFPEFEQDRVKLRITHRLDRGTSGILLIALSKETEKEIQNSFARGTFEHLFLALLDGHVDEKKITSIKLDKQENKVEVLRILKCGYYNGMRMSKALIKSKATDIEPILQFMRNIGHGVIGDPKFHTTKKAPRLFLHSWKMKLEVDEEEMIFESADPFEKFVKDDDEFMKDWQIISENSVPDIPFSSDLICKENKCNVQ